MEAKQLLKKSQPTANVFFKKQTRSCDRCRLKKRRCSGKIPCLNCIEAGVCCTMEMAQKKRGPKKGVLRRDSWTKVVMEKSPDFELISDQLNKESYFDVQSRGAYLTPRQTPYSCVELLPNKGSLKRDCFNRGIAVDVGSGQDSCTGSRTSAGCVAQLFAKNGYSADWFCKTKSRNLNFDGSSKELFPNASAVQSNSQFDTGFARPAYFQSRHPLQGKTGHNFPNGKKYIVIYPELLETFFTKMRPVSSLVQQESLLCSVVVVDVEQIPAINYIYALGCLENAEYLKKDQTQADKRKWLMDTSETFSSAGAMDFLQIMLMNFMRVSKEESCEMATPWNKFQHKYKWNVLVLEVIRATVTRSPFIINFEQYIAPSDNAFASLAVLVDGLILHFSSKTLMPVYDFNCEFSEFTIESQNLIKLYLINYIVYRFKELSNLSREEIIISNSIPPNLGAQEPLDYTQENYLDFRKQIPHNITPDLEPTQISTLYCRKSNYKFYLGNKEPDHLMLRKYTLHELIVHWYDMLPASMKILQPDSVSGLNLCMSYLSNEDLALDIKRSILFQNILFLKLIYDIHSEESQNDFQKCKYKLQNDSMAFTSAEICVIAENLQKNLVSYLLETPPDIYSLNDSINCSIYSIKQYFVSSSTIIRSALLRNAASEYSKYVDYPPSGICDIIGNKF